MATLCVSLLGTPLRAAVVQASGRRSFVKFGDRRSDEFALEPIVWCDDDGVAFGVQANFLAASGRSGTSHRFAVDAMDESDAVWASRDILAALLRRAITTAELQISEPVSRLVCIVPSDASPSIRERCVKAALLAGVADAEATDLLDGARAGDVVVELWDDSARITTVLPARTAVVEIGDLVSHGDLTRNFGKRVGLDDDRAADAIAPWFRGIDTTSGIVIDRLVDRGDPETAFVPSKHFSRLDEGFAQSMRAAFARANVTPSTCNRIAILGSWTAPLQRCIRALSPTATLRAQFAVEFEDVLDRYAARAERPSTLLHDLVALANTPRSLRALAQGQTIALIPAGTKLPVTRVFEDFASRTFLNSFWLSAKNGEAATPMFEIDIPHFAERQPASYLRVTVLADTEAFALCEVSYLYPARSRLLFFDKAKGTAETAPRLAARA